MRGPYSRRALRYLIEHGPSSASDVGGEVWKDRVRGKVCSSGGGGDYGAQMLLGRLKAAGLVQHAHSVGATLWEISTRGRKAVAE